MAPTGVALDTAQDVVGRAAKNARVRGDIRTKAGARVEKFVGIAGIAFPIQQAVGPIVVLFAFDEFLDLSPAKIVGEAIVVILRVNDPGEAELAKIIFAEYLTPRALGARHRRGQQ